MSTPHPPPLQRYALRQFLVGFDEARMELDSAIRRHQELLAEAHAELEAARQRLHLYLDEIGRSLTELAA